MAYRKAAGRLAAALMSLVVSATLPLVLTTPAHTQFVCIDSSQSTAGSSAGPIGSVACGSNATAYGGGAYNTAVGELRHGGQCG